MLSRCHSDSVTNLIQHVVVSVSFILEEAVGDPKLLVACNVDVVEASEASLLSELKPIIEPLLLKAKLGHILLE